jgi:hypothetical protein
MVDVELFPDPDHCIETAAKREYEDLVRMSLRGDITDPGAGDKLELLRGFLETADFKKLRSESEKYLQKGHKVKFVLSSEPASMCRLFVDGREISSCGFPRE